MRPIWIGFVAVMFSSTGLAQEIPLSTITSTGEASENVNPTHIEFQFSVLFEENSLVGSTGKAIAFPDTFRELIEKRNLDESQLTFRSPYVDSVNSSEVTVRGTMRFPLPGGTDLEEQILKYAALCDAVAALGKAAQASIEGPQLIVKDADLFEQETLKRATENALYKADAIAQILNTQIYEVKSVEVQELLWNTDTNNTDTAPGIDRLTCSAKVSLTYLHQP